MLYSNGVSVQIMEPKGDDRTHLQLHISEGPKEVVQASCDIWAVFVDLAPIGIFLLT